MKKVITFSANTSWYLYNFRSSSIRRLIQDGWHVVCLSPEDQYSWKLTESLGCEWIPLHVDNKGSNVLRDACLIFEFIRLYKRISPSVALHFTLKNNIYGTWAARCLGIPVINNISGLGTAFIRKGFVSAIVRFLYKASQPFAYRVFCQNPEDETLLMESKLVPRDRLELLPGSGVDLERFNPSLKRGHTGPFRFLYAGRMLADKGLYELIEAIGRVNSSGIRCSLWLSGFADAKNISSVTDNQLSQWGALPGIEWLGPTDSMEAVYASVDCVVLPSYREGMPRSLLEAGAMGLPVVATDVSGCRNIIENGFNGILCDAKSAASLERALLRMLDMSRQDRATMGENGRSLVSEKFGESLVVEATTRAIESAVTAGRNPTR